MRDDGAGGRTPLHASAWNPTTPARDAGVEHATQTGTPGAHDTPNVYSGRPRGSRPPPESTAIPARTFPTQIRVLGKLFTDAVVVLPDGRQGVLRRRDGAGGASRSARRRRCQRRREAGGAWNRRGFGVGAAGASLALAKPQKKDRVRVVAGDDNRGAAGELIGVDGTDGVLKMDETQDVSIFHIETLARVWVA